MKKEFLEYLISIGISKTMIATIENKYNRLKAFGNVNEFDDIFLSETKSKMGDREYFSLWAFSPNLIHRVAIANNEVIIFRNQINLIRLSESNFDLGRFDDKSRLEIAIRRVDADNEVIFNASGENCAQLIKILKSHLLINTIAK